MGSYLMSMITSFIIHDLRLQSAKGFSATASWGNVIQMADLFFNGMYPYIDPGTGGKISGMIAAADKILSLADNDTKIVAGHGPLGNSTPSGVQASSTATS